jgi:acyl-CoA dehydrogenase
MDFSLTDEQKLIIETTRAFVENELYPHEAEIERTGHLRPDLIDELKSKAIAAGLYAANMPEDVGGAGLDTLTWLLYEKELGRANYALHWTCVARPSNILLAGTPEQRERYLLPCVRGEKSDCLAMTEPGAGSDLRGMKASAVQQGGDWVLNGVKHFISHADIADFAIVFMATGEEQTPRGLKKRITAFFVDKGTPGFTVRDGYRNVSHRGYTNAILEFDDCRVPASAILGEVHKGFEASGRHLPRPCGTRLRPRCRMGRDSRAIRTVDRQVPGRVVQARRHGRRDEGGRTDGAGGRMEIRPRVGHRHGHGDGQAEGDRDAGLRRR